MFKKKQKKETNKGQLPIGEEAEQEDRYENQISMKVP